VKTPVVYSLLLLATLNRRKMLVADRV